MNLVLHLTPIYTYIHESLYCIRNRLLFRITNNIYLACSVQESLFKSYIFPMFLKTQFILTGIIQLAYLYERRLRVSESFRMCSSSLTPSRKINSNLSDSAPEENKVQWKIIYLSCVVCWTTPMRRNAEKAQKVGSRRVFEDFSSTSPQRIWPSENRSLLLILYRPNLDRDSPLFFTS